MRIGNLKKEKSAGKDEFTGEMVKGGAKLMIDWILKLCKSFAVQEG